MEIIHVNFKVKRVTKIEIFDIVREAEQEYDFLMNLGEDEDGIDNHNSINKTFG